jgi:hypothetical protein
MSTVGGREEGEAFKFSSKEVRVDRGVTQSRFS